MIMSKIAVATACCATSLMIIPAGAAAAGSKPRITVTPDNVMVNTAVTIVGKHGPASKKFALRECGQRSWVVTQTSAVCTADAIPVKTNKHGRFRTTYDAQVCPHDSGSGPVTRAKCFIGRPRPSGVDTLHLAGHAKLIVTYP
jgi:hypothetical protein